jgi:hypothetical protein
VPHDSSGVNAWEQTDFPADLRTIKEVPRSRYDPRRKRPPRPFSESLGKDVVVAGRCAIAGDRRRSVIGESADVINAAADPFAVAPAAVA